MDTAQFSAFFIFALSSSLTPGPNNVMMMMSGSLFGFKATVPHMLGVIIGFAVLLVSAVFGLSVILEQLPWLTLAIRILGTVWLGWLGLSFILSAARESGAEDQVKTAVRPLRFYEAALFQWANPKALIVATSCAGAFLTLAPTASERAAFMVAGFVLAGLPSTITWTLAGSALSVLMTTGQHAKYVQIALGVLMLLTAASLLAL